MHAEQKKKTLFDCGNHNTIFFFNISQKKGKITYSKYKTNSKLKLQGWCTGKFYNIIISVENEGVTQCQLLGMNITIQTGEKSGSVWPTSQQRGHQIPEHYSLC